MRRKKGRSQASETLDPVSQEAPIQSQNASPDSKGFFACYLLLSLNPRFKGHTYIGFTVNPRRRIRQHNGEIGSGAWRTKRRRPWEMVLCIYGFPTNVAALQFEWAWQHPVESLAVRKAAATFKSLSGIANKIKLAYTMLTLPSWQSMNMTVNFFSTKYMQHCAGCPSLPEHMKVQICSMDELPCYTGLYGLSDNEDDGIDEEECGNITSNGDVVPDAFDGSVTHFSPQNEEPEAIEPCLPIASLKRKLSPVTTSVREEIIEDRDVTSLINENSEAIESCLPLASLKRKLSPVTTSVREEVIEDRDVTSLMNENSDELSQPDSKQSDSASAANENKEFRSSFIVPSEAEIIDLSSPSPSCRGFSGRKKRSVYCVGSNDYIDLTKSPNFIQL